MNAGAIEMTTRTQLQPGANKLSDPGTVTAEPPGPDRLKIAPAVTSKDSSSKNSKASWPVGSFLLYVLASIGAIVAYVISLFVPPVLILALVLLLVGLGFLGRTLHLLNAYDDAESNRLNNSSSANASASTKTLE